MYFCLHYVLCENRARIECGLGYDVFCEDEAEALGGFYPILGRPHYRIRREEIMPHLMIVQAGGSGQRQASYLN